MKALSIFSLLLLAGCSSSNKVEASMPGSTLTWPEAFYFGAYFISSGLVVIGLGIAFSKALGKMIEKSD
jgi:hypothetical protein